MSDPPDLRATANPLRRRLDGRLLLAGDPGYEDVRAPGNLLVDPRPAIVVEPASTADVVRAVAFAERHRLGVSVMATGRGLAPAPAGQMLIATRRLDQVTIDRPRRLARVAAGATWRAVARAAAAHGLAPVAGTAAHVGAVGSALGGGIGWLTRAHGTAAENVRAFEIVTPDARRRVASVDDNPTLFWSLCGAGAGNYGVVTAMEVDLVPLGDVVAGALWYPGELAGEVLERWSEWISTVPAQLTSSVTLGYVADPTSGTFPTGRPMVAVRACHSGAPDDGMALLGAWRAWRAPLHDTCGVVPFPATASLGIDPPETARTVMAAEWLTHVDRAVVDTLCRQAFTVPVAPTAADLMHVGTHVGKSVASAPPRSAAGCAERRAEPLLLRAVSRLPCQAVAPQVTAQLAQLRTSLAHASRGRTQLDLCGPGERATRLHDALDAEAVDRLRRVQAMLDPAAMLTGGFLRRAHGPLPGG